MQIKFIKSCRKNHSRINRKYGLEELNIIFLILKKEEVNNFLFSFSENRIQM